MMNMNSVSWKWSFWAYMVLFLGLGLVQCDVVTYDRKSLIINGERKILISGSIHYPRSTPEMWKDLIDKAKFGGLDVIETYVFWDGHEPSRGNYNFEGRYDLVRFLKTIQNAGLYAFLRVGPYVCAEWNFGGFPVWLKYVPGISFRTDNEPFKNAMQSFTRKIVDLMKSEKLYASQGGPIILSQIENEYGPLAKINGIAGLKYTNWAAQMAVEMDTGVPWVMCKQDDAPDPVINTCNGFYCDTFSANKVDKPKIWTESWTSWFTQFGGPKYQRPVQDMAFAVAKFIMKEGSLVNYYMYHGGTNFGRTAGGPFVTTSYDYDAPLDEYGLFRQPKFSHLKELHKAIKQCEAALVSTDPVVTNLGRLQEAYVYKYSRGCAAFLSNYDTQFSTKLLFNEKHYSLPARSISILPDCTNEVFNTAKVSVQTSKMKMEPSGAQMFSWEANTEDVTASVDSSAFTAEGLLEQISVTRDLSDYLWYKTTVKMESREFPTLIVQSYGHALHVFVNGKLVGSKFGTKETRKCTFNSTIKLHPGSNAIDLLSVAVGLPNIGPNFELRKTGVSGPVALEGLEQGKKDLTGAKWTYQVGLKGESMNLASPNSLSSVEWTQGLLPSHSVSPLTWFRATFNAPSGNEPLALDMGSMGKGQMWINGKNIGRYWTSFAVGNCNASCSYKGAYRPNKCQTGCGKPTQRWYHVPRAWLKPTENQLVVLEEVGGDPTKISLDKRRVASVCADVAEYHPNFKNWKEEIEGINGERIEMKFVPSKVRLSCSRGQVISAIKFASFGTPRGTCGAFTKGTCHAYESLHIFKKKCIGKRVCRVATAISNFAKDPCPNKLKRLSVEAECGYPK